MARAHARTQETERVISYIRLAVVVFNTVTYLALGSGPEARRGFAIAIILAAALYSVAALVWTPSSLERSLVAPIVDTVLDNVVIGLWLYATGGFASPFFPLLYAEAAATVGRFGVVIGAGISVLSAAMYVLVALGGGSSSPAYDLVVRVDYVFVIVAFVGYVVEASRRNERVAAEAETRADALNELNQLKSNFVSTISHELRTPLTAIRGAATTLTRNRARFDDSQEDALLGMIDRQSQHLSRLVQDLIDVSLVDRKKLMTQVETVNIAQLVQTEIAGCSSLGTHDISVSLPNDGLVIVCDRKKVARAVNALLDNAMKFSKQGSSIQVEVRDEGSDVAIAVEDAGVGVGPEQQSLIFDRFYQVDSSPTRAAEGAGIGLAVAQELVRLHGGSISVKSEPGNGSRFTIRLPKSGPIPTVL